MARPKVTIICVPRERFGHAKASLESLLAETEPPYKLIYVDGGSPAAERDHLQRMAISHGFQLIRSDIYLTPNQARNIGLRGATTPYVAFVDNDVEVTPGWLEALVACADETGADVVTPLICQGTPVHETIHFAGGACGVREDVEDGRRRRHIVEDVYLQGRKVADERHRLVRAPTRLAEFHCMLVRTSVFDRLGPLDEKLLSTKEHVDLCMSVQQIGGTIWLEPSSLVTYVFGTWLRVRDMPYFMLRWSDAWERASLEHLRAKWDLTEDDYFRRRTERLGWRRHMVITGPLSRRLLPRPAAGYLERALNRVDRRLNAALAAHASRHAI
ncbi:MAG: glycosyltransferase [Thermodesulfobacteriota bacterium]